jgi:hypothetical protein
MNETLQFGPHPDADQISAFVEHALPAHEQVQMLGHLSVCQECRAIVALSLPPAQEPAPSVVAPLRRPWWSGWSLAWPAAAAVAALAIFLITVHHAVEAPNAPAPSQSAASHPPVSLIAPGQAAAPSGQQPQRAPATRSKQDRTGTSDSKPPVATQQSPDRTVTQRDVSSLPINGRNARALDRIAQEAPSAEPGSSGKNGASAGGAGRRLTGAFGSANGVGAGASSGAADGILGSPEGQPKVAAAAPARPAAAQQARGQASETVAVTSAAQNIETETPDIGNLAIAPSQAEIAPLKHRLPSKLPVLSVAAEGLRLVAIDTRNAVFVSKDGGRHWKAVHPQWAGRAVTAVLVNFPTEKGPRNVSKRAPMAQALQSSPSARVENDLPVLAPPRQSTTSTRLTGTVKDPSGAVVPGASVTIHDPLSHASRTVTTDRAGHYQIEGLTPGTYQLEAQAPGFKKQTLTAVAIGPKGPSVADVTLDVGAVSQTVEVTSAAGAIETTHTPLSDQISGIKPAGTVAFIPAPSLFEITTDNGERWTSTDGVTWNRQ